MLMMYGAFNEGISFNLRVLICVCGISNTILFRLILRTNLAIAIFSQRTKSVKEILFLLDNIIKISKL